MKITFLGGADEVGASSALLEIGGKHILVDAGIRPSPKGRHGLASDQLPHLEAIQALDAVLVTHAHTDHTGALELIAERFPKMPVYATSPTIALTRVLHQDSRRIMQTRFDEEGELPIFDDLAVQRLMSAFVPVPFRTRLVLGEGLAVTFFPAGHIAGAAMLGIESDEGNILISGDLSISPQRTVDGARPPAFHPDILLIESTYGGRLHANRAVQERKLVEVVARVTGEGGKVLIPAFALGRAQEILLILNEFRRRDELPDVPVWADGMVRAICQAYSSFIEDLPLPLQESGAQFFTNTIRPVQSQEQRNALIWETNPAIIVASSGMLAGGPSLSYARSLAAQPQHAILLTGYQDEESPGRRLQEVAKRGSGSIWLGKDKVDVQCLLGTYSLSAHADESQLINLAEALGPEHILLVHGDEPARASLEKALSERGRIVHLPRAGQTLEFHFKKRKVLGPGTVETELRANQEEINRLRCERMVEFSGSIGKWMLLRGNPPVPVRCQALESDHLWVEVAPGLGQAVYPEEVLQVLGETAPTPSEMAANQPRPGLPTVMEPNQALAFTNQQFPSEARLRKVGYRQAERILVLNFDFPDMARSAYHEQIAALEIATGWQVELAPEANQAALNVLAREVLPDNWQIVKGPAVYRDQKRVAVSVSAPASVGEAEASEIAARYQAISGYGFNILFASQSPMPVIIPVASRGERLEINAAYTLIKSWLEGTSLYKTSLKGDEILLSFISPQVGERYLNEIEELSLRTGYRLSINPNPSQGAILEIAAALIQSQGWTLGKKLSIFPEAGEVRATLIEDPDIDLIAQVVDSFEEQTGFTLSIHPIAPPASQSTNLSAPQPAPPDMVEIPIKAIRLSRYYQTISLDPLKLSKAIERARQMGIKPPITVRRGSEDYLLVDGLYRLRAAEALGLERIPAVVE